MVIRWCCIIRIVLLLLTVCVAIACWISVYPVESQRCLATTSPVLTISNDAEQITRATIHNPDFFRKRTEKIHYES